MASPNKIQPTSAAFNCNHTVDETASIENNYDSKPSPSLDGAKTATEAHIKAIKRIDGLLNKIFLLSSEASHESRLLEEWDNGQTLRLLKCQCNDTLEYEPLFGLGNTTLKGKNAALSVNHCVFALHHGAGALAYLSQGIPVKITEAHILEVIEDRIVICTRVKIDEDGEITEVRGQDRVAETHSMFRLDLENPLQSPEKQDPKALFVGSYGEKHARADDFSWYLDPTAPQYGREQGCYVVSEYPARSQPDEAVLRKFGESYQRELLDACRPDVGRSDEWDFIRGEAELRTLHRVLYAEVEQIGGPEALMKMSEKEYAYFEDNMLGLMGKELRMLCDRFDDLFYGDMLADELLCEYWEILQSCPQEGHVAIVGCVEKKGGLPLKVP